MNKQILKNIIFAGLFIVPFIPFVVTSSLFFPFITGKAFLWRILVEIIFATWLLLAFYAEEYRPKKSPLLLALAAFIVVIGVADLFGVAPHLSFWSNYERMEGFLALLHLGAFFLVISTVFNELDWKRWWNTSLVASGLVIIYGLFQLLGVAEIHQGGARVDATFGNAIYLAVYLLFHIFIALFYMVREFRNKGLRWSYGILIFFQILILYYTATRGAILGLLGGLIIFALLNIRNKEQKSIRKFSIVVIVGVVVLVGGFFAVRNTQFVKTNPVLGRFASLSAAELKSQGRYFVWPMAVAGIKEHPLLGWGQENFMYVFQEHYQPEMFNLEPWFDRAHNIFLDWAIAGGLLGLVLYLSLYGVPLYLLWKRGEGFSYVEKSVLTALLAAYFFHNFFVFDHQTSYILFFSLLSYLQYRHSGRPLWKFSLSKIQLNAVALPVVAILLVFTLYTVNYKPLRANTELISALQSLQSSSTIALAPQFFEAAYASTTPVTMGKVEASEQIGASLVQVLSDNSIPMEKRNEYYLFVVNQFAHSAPELLKSARYELIVGSTLSSLGQFDQAFIHLNHAVALAPGKQQVYFELGSVYINTGDYEKALAAFKKAYDLAPDYTEAKVVYLLGAIYAHNITIENEMLSVLLDKEVFFDDRVLNAYSQTGRADRVSAIIQFRKEVDPKNAAQYDALFQQLLKK